MRHLNFETVEQMAREKGLKMTPQRRAIIEYLQVAEHHPTPDEVIVAVNDRYPMSSRATVYNTINWLKESGMLSEVHEGGITRLDPNCDRHHHFVCNVCGKVEDVAFEMFSESAICSMPGSSSVETFEVTLRGTCSSCQ